MQGSSAPVPLAAADSPCPRPLAVGRVHRVPCETSASRSCDPTTQHKDGRNKVSQFNEVELGRVLELRGMQKSEISDCQKGATKVATQDRPHQSIVAIHVTPAAKNGPIIRSTPLCWGRCECRLDWLSMLQRRQQGFRPAGNSVQFPRMIQRKRFAMMKSQSVYTCPLRRFRFARLDQ